jgi:hypothetical protein
MISNIVHWLGGGAAVEKALPAGEVFTPAPGEKIGLVSWAGAKESVGTETGEPVELRESGFYKVRGESERWLAVNTADAAESDLRQSAHNNAVFSNATAWIGLGLWQALAALALALLVLEWFLHHRRVTE